MNIEQYLSAHIKLSSMIDANQIQNAIDLIKHQVELGKKIITCGNGGSANTASHYITDWNKMVNIATHKRFYGICLNDNIGLVTAFANDLSYEDVFSGQLKAIMEPGDLLIAISGSGKSKNILKAIQYANEISGKSLGILGYDGGEAIKIVQQCVHIPSFDMQLCEDFHLMFGHMVMKQLANCSLIYP